MSLAALNLLLFAGELLAASILLPLMAWSVNLFFRERAAMRHLIWLAVFGALLLLPLLALLVPSQLVVERAGPSMMAYGPPPLSVADAIPAPFWNVTAVLIALLALWGTGVAWNLLRLALGVCVLHRLRRRSTPFKKFFRCAPGAIGPARLWLAEARHSAAVGHAVLAARKAGRGVGS